MVYHIGSLSLVLPRWNTVLHYLTLSCHVRRDLQYVLCDSVGNFMEAHFVVYTNYKHFQKPTFLIYVLTGVEK